MSDGARKSNGKKALIVLANIVPFAAYLSIGSVYPAFLFLSATIGILLCSRWAFSFVLGYTACGALLLALLQNSHQFVSAEKFFSVMESEKHTDFVFSLVRSSSGIVASISVALSICLIVCLVQIILEIKNAYSKTLVTGAAIVISGGLLSGIFSNLGFVPMPVTGINFPFLSYGGSMLVGHFALIGMILGQYRRKSISII